MVPNGNTLGTLIKNLKTLSFKEEYDCYLVLDPVKNETGEVSRAQAHNINKAGFRDYSSADDTLHYYIEGEDMGALPLDKVIDKIDTDFGMYELGRLSLGLRPKTANECDIDLVINLDDLANVDESLTQLCEANSECKNYSDYKGKYDTFTHVPCYKGCKELNKLYDFVESL